MRERSLTVRRRVRDIWKCCSVLKLRSSSRRTDAHAGRGIDGSTAKLLPNRNSLQVTTSNRDKCTHTLLSLFPPASRKDAAVSIRRTPPVVHCQGRRATRHTGRAYRLAGGRGGWQAGTRKGRSRTEDDGGAVRAAPVRRVLFALRDSRRHVATV